MKFELINKETKEVITTREMRGVTKLKIAEVVFGMLKNFQVVVRAFMIMQLSFCNHDFSIIILNIPDKIKIHQ